MISIHLRCGLLLCASFVCTATLCAQQNAAPGPAPASRIDLDVVVTAKTGPPVGDLQQQDFTLFDNKTPRHLTSFQAVTGSQNTTHILLLIDAVNTSYENIAYERGEVDKFLRANGGHLPQPMALAFFTDTGTQIQSTYTTDGNALSTSFDQYAIGLRNVRRSSQYQAQDRLNLSLKALGQIVMHEADLPGRKLIFWVSPGWPLLSGPRIELDGKQLNQIFASIVGLSTDLRRARLILYSISPLGTSEGLGRDFYYQTFLKGVGDAHKAELGDLSLQVLAVQSGGLALTSSNDVASLLNQCLVDAQSYYEVSFDASPADRRDEYHSLEIKVDKPGLSARTRQGYYAQP
jgi:VWFA-related protein